MTYNIPQVATAVATVACTRSRRIRGTDVDGSAMLIPAVAAAFQLALMADRHKMAI